MTFSAINLAALPAPDVVETLDFEAILAEMKADLITRAPHLASVLALESDPINKLLEAFAYRDMVMRARINDATRAVMLATARGADLDHLAALYGVGRLLIDAGDPHAIPSRAAVWESDDDLRARVQLAPEAMTVAGPRGAYEYHARSASADIADVAIDSPAPGSVRVTVLSRSGDGTALPDTLNAVLVALNDERVRPLCDTVTVRSATITTYQIAAQLTLAPGPDSAVVLENARAAVEAYATSIRRIGQPVTISGLHAALHRPGVVRVALTAPLAEVTPGQGGVARCTAINLTVAP